MDWIREYGWFFFIYALLGWCGEVAFAAVKEKHFVNRGFLNGPLCPIYGVGVVAIVGLGLIAGDNVFVLFVISAIVTSLIELVTGYVLKKLFRTRWWDYSDMPLNIGGYICLPFSLLWGAACVVIIKVNICGLDTPLAELAIPSPLYDSPRYRSVRHCISYFQESASAAAIGGTGDPTAGIFGCAGTENIGYDVGGWEEGRPRQSGGKEKRICAA